jgi:alpha-amylase
VKRLVIAAALCGLQAVALAQGASVDTRPVSAIHGASALAPGWQNGAFMEIFVRAYRDSDGDGIGDLRGLIQSLDYLRDLGIKGIWLMPVNPSADRDHGYATTDYRAIEPAYGSLADFDELLKQAHARGIGVIIDYVINHSAASHPLFVDSQRAESPFRDWYLWQPTEPPAGTSGARTPGRRRQTAPSSAPSGRTCPTSTCAIRTWSSTTRAACASGSTAGSTAFVSTPCRTWSRTTSATGTTSPRAGS